MPGSSWPLGVCVIRIFSQRGDMLVSFKQVIILTLPHCMSHNQDYNSGAGLVPDILVRQPRQHNGILITLYPEDVVSD